MVAPPNPRTFIITGGSSGIGLAVAGAFLERGDNVVLNGRDEKKLHAAADGLGAPGRVALVTGDMADRETARALVQAAKKRFGALDGVVNNAGHFISKPFEQYEPADLDGLLGVHLKGAFGLLQEAVPEMRERGGGSVVNITTVLATRGESRVPAAAPAAVKGSLNSLTRSLAIELARDNIRVNAIAPGVIKTPIFGIEDEAFERFNGMQPLGRVGEAHDVAKAALYLTDADFVTGAILHVDGGIEAGV